MSILTPVKKLIEYAQALGVEKATLAADKAALAKENADLAAKLVVAGQDLTTALSNDKADAEAIATANTKVTELTTASETANAKAIELATASEAANAKVAELGATVAALGADNTDAEALIAAFLPKDEVAPEKVEVPAA